MMMTMASVRSVGVAVTSTRVAGPRVRMIALQVVLVRVTTVVVLMPSSRHRRTLARIAGPREPGLRTGSRAERQPDSRERFMNSRFSASPCRRCSRPRRAPAGAKRAPTYTRPCLRKTRASV